MRIFYAVCFLQYVRTYIEFFYEVKGEVESRGEVKAR